MFKGFTILSAALISTSIFAGSSTLISCPDLGELKKGNYGMTVPLVPGKMYIDIQEHFFNSQKFGLIVGPVKADNIDSAEDIVPYILNNTKSQGQLEYTADGAICTYSYNGVEDIYVTAFLDEESGNQSFKTKLLKKMK